MSGAVALVVAAVPIIPAATSAGAGSVPAITHHDMSDVSAHAKKKPKARRKAPKKEEYLRAAPSEPPPGARK
jgi:hypothetical protein